MLIVLQVVFLLSEAYGLDIIWEGPLPACREVFGAADWMVDEASSSDESIYAKILEGLLRGHEPNLSGFKSSEVRAAAQKAFYSPLFLPNLKRLVIEESRGSLRLEDADSTIFPAIPRGPANFLILKRAFSKNGLLVIFVPYDVPFNFFKPSKRKFWSPWF